jgi:exosortase A
MNAVSMSTSQVSPWRHALPTLLLLIAAILLLYRETAAAMLDIWLRSDTFAHAILVPPISLWLIWRQRDRLAALTPRAQPWILGLLGVVAGLWLLADLVVVNAATQFALVAMVVLAVPAVLGLEVALAILFPLMFLFFSVPFGDFMLPLMMEWTADFTVAALKLSGIPVYREGLQFVIPSGNWSVVEACGGVRYLIASFMVGTLFAYLNYRSNRRRAIFMAVSIAMPIVANWLRAYMIVMLGHLSGNKLAVGVDHLIYGWVFFGVVIMIMFMVGARWSEPELPTSSAAPLPATGRGAPAALRFVSPAALAATALAGAVIVGLPHAAQQGLQRAQTAGAVPQLALPAQLAGGWSTEGAELVPWQPRFQNPSAQVQRSYARTGGGTVGVYLGYYRGQGPDRKLVSSQNMLVTSDDRRWNQLSVGRQVHDVAGQPMGVRAADLLGAGPAASGRRAHLLVWQLYWVDGRWIDRDAPAKLAGAWAGLQGRGDDGAVLVLYTDQESKPAATRVLQQFMTDNLDPLASLLQRTRDAR